MTGQLRNPAVVPPGVLAVGYLRVSTERQAGEVFTSLDDQAVAVTALAARLGVSIGAWYRDEGASGATVEQRPAFRTMLAGCLAAPRRRPPGYVLVLNDSRFGRFPDPDQAAALRWQFKEAGWIVRFAEGDDIEDATFRPVVRAIGAAEASKYRATLKANTRRGMKGTASQGFWTREAPFGYRRQVVYPPGAARVLGAGQLKTSAEKVKLTPHEDEAEWVRWCFTTYAAGTHSLGDLVRELTRRAPDRRWRRIHLHRMLTNPVYVGDVVGGVRSARDERKAKQYERPESDRYGCRDAHPPLVTRALFADVQARLTANRRNPHHARSVYLLSGLVRCATCDRPMVGGGGRKRPGGGLYSFYRCSIPDRPEAFGYPPCPGPMTTVSRAVLDAAVVDLIADTLRGPRAAARIGAAIDGLLSARAAPLAPDVADQARAKSALESKRGRLVTAIADGTLTRTEAASELAAVRAGLARLDAVREAAESAAAVQLDATTRAAIIARAQAFGETAARVVAAGQSTTLRKLIRPWLARATFDKHSRELVLGIHRLPADVVDVGPDDDGATRQVPQPNVAMGAVGSIPLSRSPRATRQQHTYLVRRVSLATPQFLGQQRRKRERAGTEAR